MKNLSYVVQDVNTNHTAIVDPTWDIDLLLNFVSLNQLIVTSIWLTHTHYDHLQGLDACTAAFPNIEIVVHQLEVNQLNYSKVREVYNHEMVLLGQSSWQIIHTPGHSVGGICFYSPNHLISGDTLFINGCGRADITGANVTDLYRSLQVLRSLPDQTIVYPGHHYGPKLNDTIESQKVNNRFFSDQTLNQFIKLRMR